MIDLEVDSSTVIMTDAVKPYKKKADLAYLVQSNGGKLYQKPDAAPDTICIGDKRKSGKRSLDIHADLLEGTVPVASLIKRGEVDIVRPSWLLDCIEQTTTDGDRPRMLLPFEPRHMFFARDESAGIIDHNVDVYGDSFARDVGLDELRTTFEGMPKLETPFKIDQFQNQLEEHHHGLGDMPSCMFEGTVMHADRSELYKQNRNPLCQGGLERFDRFHLRMEQACRTARFAGARFTDDFDDMNTTHILSGNGRERAKELRKAIST